MSWTSIKTFLTTNVQWTDEQILAMIRDLVEERNPDDEFDLEDTSRRLSQFLLDHYRELTIEQFYLVAGKIDPVRLVEFLEGPWDSKHPDDAPFYHIDDARFLMVVERADPKGLAQFLHSRFSFGGRVQFHVRYRMVIERADPKKVAQFLWERFPWLTNEELHLVVEKIDPTIIVSSWLSERYTQDKESLWYHFFQLMDRLMNEQLRTELVRIVIEEASPYSLVNLLMYRFSELPHQQFCEAVERADPLDLVERFLQCNFSVLSVEQLGIVVAKTDSHMLAEFLEACFSKLTGEQILIVAKKVDPERLVHFLKVHSSKP
jgi:hypothetical protein